MDLNPRALRVETECVLAVSGTVIDVSEPEDEPTAAETAAAIEAVDFESDDPYAGVDISNLPSWWRTNLREFSDHALRTYLPSRFADGEVVPLVFERLEAQYDIDVQLIGVGVSRGDDWELRVDGDPVVSIGRHRSRGGYSVLEPTSEAVVQWVEAAAADR